ncbi:MAG: hypothetical protein IJ877_07760 [Candidatus Gastranaerophilales bacterium]|nr:hypothetical protein [Candidatus Gastranaerophilales bacterium]
MKILFYDIKEFEFDYLLSKVPNNIEPYFFKTALNPTTYIDEKYINSEAISVFVSSRLDSVVLSRFKNLKYIFLRCTGYSNVDLKYCKRHNIKLFNTPNYGSSSVAEFAFGLILNLTRKIAIAQNSINKGEINQNDLMGVNLKNKTLGIIGAGNIGKNTAEIAKGFKMNIIVNDIKQDDDYNYVSLDELAKQSDFLVITCPLTPKTKGLINRDFLNNMKKEAIIINVARGEIVDTKALTEALVKNKIKGCALDVIECEETLCALWDFCVNTDKREDCLKKFLFIQKLKQMPNVIITPHIAYNTKEALIEILNITLENIQSSFQINSDTKNLVML